MSNLMKGHKSVGHVATSFGRARVAQRRGIPLPDEIRRNAEELFGEDFSDVQVIVSDAAPRIGAIAFTTGSEIHIAPGVYRPGTSQTLALLGHELAHVVQQRRGTARNDYGYGVQVVRDEGLEREADRMGRALQMMYAPHPPRVHAVTRRVLLVDDAAFNLISWTVLMERYHCAQIDTASNGSEGYGLFEAAYNAGNSYTLIITDNDMPIMNGIKMVGQIRELQHKEMRGGRVGIISSSDSTIEHGKYSTLAKQYEDLGVSVVPKPFGNEQLQAAIEAQSELYEPPQPLNQTQQQQQMQQVELYVPPGSLNQFQQQQPFQQFEEEDDVSNDDIANLGNKVNPEVPVKSKKSMK